MSGYKEIKPEFYDKFSCIADQCSFTCCQEWKITVDEETYQNWKLKLVKDVWKQTHKQDGNRVITLDREKRCPHLNECGLCSLVLSHGEKIISKTCHTFPREEHSFSNRKELTLMPCCPEVVDYLKKDCSFGLISQMKEYEKDWTDEEIISDTDKLLFTLRRIFIEILENQEYSLAVCYQMCFYIALEVLSAEGDNHKLLSILKDCQTKEIRKQMAEQIKSILPDALETFFERNELFLDVTANYQKEGLYKKHLADCIELAEAFLDETKYSEDDIYKEIEAFHTYINSYEELLRNYMIGEVYADTILPDSTLTDFVMKLQWISMEYAVLMQKLFLDYHLKFNSYAKIRDAVVVVSRMMGYDEADIEEYLNNSFDEMIWEWGYQSLLMGE